MPSTTPLLLVLALVCSSEQRIVDGQVVLDAETLENHEAINLQGQWRFSHEDKPDFARPGYPDAGWALRDPTKPPDPGEQGVSWYRIRVEIPKGVRRERLALWVVPMGAYELYVDGRRVGGVGDPSADGGFSQPDDRLLVSMTADVYEVTFGKQTAVIALRFRPSSALAHTLGDDNGGAAMAIGFASKISSRRLHGLQVVRMYRSFIGISFALGLLHFLLFVFLPERKENLQYALATWSVCGLSVSIEARTMPISPEYFIFAHVAFKFCIVGVSVFGVKFYHAVLGDPPRPLFKLYLALGIVLALGSYWVPVVAVYVYSVYGVFEQIRLTMVANLRGMRDAWLLAVGVSLSGIGALLQMVPILLGAPLPVEHAYIYGFLGMLMMMSAYQARGFARTYRDLKHRLDDVRRLSEERVEQARRVKSEEMARVRLEEENKRQAIELEEAERRKEMLAQLESAHQELKDTQAQLVQSEKMASLGQLVAGIAHEINTPVGAISSVHDSLTKATARLKEALREESPELLEESRRVRAALKVIDDANGVIESGSGRVAGIVRRLKSFARLDEAELLRANVHEGLDDTLLLLHHELKRDIKVHRQYGDVPPFHCFPSQLNQVFLNLLVNARQAIEGFGEIFIETKVVDGQAFIAIRDTGRGIPKANLPKIFDPGFTTKGVKVGTGLGLSICYRIIKDHRGEIRVTSEEGHGATFTIVLPLDLDRQLDGKLRA